MNLHQLDWLFVTISILGAGVLFGTRSPAELGSLRTRNLIVRLVAAVAMIVPGAIVSHLFGTPGSWQTLAKTAVALWLAPLVLGMMRQMQRDAADQSP